MNAREHILTKLRAALPALAAAQAAPAVAGYYAAHAAITTRAERVTRLAGLLETAHAEVMVAEEAEWPQLLAARLAALGVQRLAVGADSAEARRLTDAAGDGLRPVPFVQPIEAWKQHLFDSVDAGFTVADGAIAATGTLVLKSSPQQPRSLSLVPPLHVALVREADIHADLFSAARDGAWAGGLPTNLILVSGPSKTSDIQQTLAYGAHGPKQMLVVIVRAGAAA